ncbi:TEL2-interacting protein 1 [Meyerozyma sp. JA9]|nr:TEL2-interacting protein 1 [Meyerozyma sp. JA9]
MDTPDQPHISGDRWSAQDLSVSLFQKVKPICVELSSKAVLPPEELKSNSPQISRLLKQLVATLQHHYDLHNETALYILTPKIADYVFFPISCLLKSPDVLDVKITTFILQAIRFLIDHCWATGDMDVMADQMFPLVLFLVQTNKLSTGSFESQKTVIDCISSLMRHSSMEYFTDNPRRLPWLGAGITLYLDIMESVGKVKGHDETALVNEILASIRYVLSRKMSGPQTSEVFPGVSSRVIKFATSTSGLHVDVYINILKLLQAIIISVLNDEALGATLVEEDETNIESIKRRFNVSEIKNVPITFTSKSELPKGWHKATSEQLLLLLTVFFKDLLKNPNKSKMIYTHISFADTLHTFFVSIMENCFLSLFEGCVPLFLDSLVLLISHGPTNGRTSKVKSVVSDIVHGVAMSDHHKIRLFQDLVQNKLEDLVLHKMPTVLLSTDESRILDYLCSIEVHFQLLMALSHDIHSNNQKEFGAKILLNLRDNLCKSYSLSRIQDSSSASFKPSSLNSASEHTLDGIDLGPNINTQSIVRKDKASNTEQFKPSHNMLSLSHNWQQYQNAIVTNEATSTQLFSGVFTLEVESQIALLVQSVVSGDAWTSNEQIRLTETLLSQRYSGSNQSPTYQRLANGISLWIAKLILQTQQTRTDVSLNDFLDLEDSDSDTSSNDLLYLIMSNSQDIIESASHELETPEEISPESRQLVNVTERSVAVAIDTIAELSAHFTIAEFQEIFLMDNLYTLFEGVATSSEIVRSSSLHALSEIVKNYYHGSIENLVKDNSDYIVDSLSLRLSSANTFTLTMPSILLIIIKVTGKQLLLLNQLSDILTQMFIIIDSYHGYSALVECFFIIFDELISQVAVDYMNGNVLEEGSKLPFAPWGIQSIDELLNLLVDSGRVVDPFAKYDSEREYFKRKEGVPFAEQLEDSDDEEEEEEEPETNDDEDSYSSPIPRNIYFTLQKIYVYGFRLLTSPSVALKRQILATLRTTYPLLATEYSLVMPLVAEQWPTLISVASGQFEESSVHNSTLTTSALELAITMVCEDKKHSERFLASRFIESWTYLKKVVSSDRHVFTPAIRKLVVKYLLQGLVTYGKTVPDSVSYTMLEACVKLGLPEDQVLSRDMENILWVINHQ